jgi:hypothetical protein
MGLTPVPVYCYDARINPKEKLVKKAALLCYYGVLAIISIVILGCGGEGKKTSLSKASAEKLKEIEGNYEDLVCGCQRTKADLMACDAAWVELSIAGDKAVYTNKFCKGTIEISLKGVQEKVIQSSSGKITSWSKNGACANLKSRAEEMVNKLKDADLPYEVDSPILKVTFGDECDVYRKKGAGLKKEPEANPLGAAGNAVGLPQFPTSRPAYEREEKQSRLSK